MIEPEDEEQDQQPPRRMARRDVLSTELETLKAELEHEQSLRALDAKRSLQQRQRLERQIEFAVEENQQTKAMMEALQSESERHMDQLKSARIQAQMQLRDCQLQLEEALQAASVLDDEEENNPKWDRLTDQVKAKEMENEALKEAMEDLREELRATLLIAKQQAPSSSSSSMEEEPNQDGSASAAPTAVLQELNRVRIQLAESERTNRQLQRNAEEFQQNAKQLVHERESARSALGRGLQLETKLQNLYKAHESVQAQLQSWKEFGASMEEETIITTGGRRRPLLSSDDQPNAPPEVAVVLRVLKDAMKRAEESEHEKGILQKQLDKMAESRRILESDANTFGRKETAWRKEQQDLEKRIERSEKQITVLKGQENVWKREVESLRGIVKTFDELPLGGKEQQLQSSSSSSLSGGAASQASVCMLQSSLIAAKDEIKILKEGQAGMKKDLNTAISEKAELQKTHNTVLEKFGKLRDAVYAEREKAEKAEARACQAEELAGKGSFNPETTRVLHLQKNPLTEALKQEVSVLRRQVEVLSGGKQNTSSLGTDVDPNKLHQRLKESFKEQIGRFREGVYLMTGFKIDMIPGDNRPMFKVRSLFAEHEKDHLMFKWPEGKDVHSLDMMATEHAKLLTTTPSYEYVSRFHSIPAFLASVQLSLFEKQTMMQ